MGIVEVIIVLLMALVIGAIFFYGLRSRGPWSAFWVFLLVLFLAGVAGRLWITPAGPVMWGFGWLPVLFFIFIVAVLVAVSGPSDSSTRRTGDSAIDDIGRTRGQTTEPEEEVSAAFGIFFWLLLILLITAIVAGLYMY